MRRWMILAAPLAGSTSAPHWAPNSNILYSIDYARGLDVLEWMGPEREIL